MSNLSTKAKTRPRKAGDPSLAVTRIFVSVRTKPFSVRKLHGTKPALGDNPAHLASIDLASDFRSGALPLPFSGHSISFARLPVLLFSGHLPVFPRENAFSNNFQKNAAFWENPEKIWLKFGQNSAKFWEILQNFVKISEIFSDF